MNYIVFDLEFNQDFSTNQDYVKDCLKSPFEIIQIGAIKLDSSFNTIESFNSYIKPTIYSKVSSFITKLTGITTEELLIADTFPKVYKEFIDFIDDNESVFCIWGLSDIKEIFKNVHYHKLDSSLLSKRFINIQPYVSKLLGFKANNLPKLQFAVEKFDIEIPYEFHNALYDAYYTSEVFKKIYNSSIKPTIYDPFYVKARQKKEKVEVDYDGLFKQFGKMYNRHITEEEKEIIKLAYKMGRTHQFLN
ncbi:3'-5' exonuclease, partial [Clostridium sp.]|uniref:3'-5' exonuclease n=1 Tax=Clostridium sp. TaxID=1506 RepID=UPI00260A4F06